MLLMDFLESVSLYESISCLKNSQMRLSFIGLFTDKLNVKRKVNLFFPVLLATPRPQCNLQERLCTDRLRHGLRLNSGVEGICESEYTKRKGETWAWRKLYALLYKACYDRRMKIKRGRQILSTAQKILTVYQDAEMGMQCLSNMLHTKPVLKMTVQHSMLKINHPIY